MFSLSKMTMGGHNVKKIGFGIPNIGAILAEMGKTRRSLGPLPPSPLLSVACFAFGRHAMTMSTKVSSLKVPNQNCFP